MRAGLPLLIVGHGTRSAEGVAGFRRLVERVRGLAGPGPAAVDGGFIELSAPSVAEAVQRLPVAAHPDVVAVPLVLTAAGHGKGDIPAALARERRHRPGLRWRYGRPLGPHPVLQDVLADRADAALDGRPRAETQVVLVGRGSTDPDGNAEVAKVARLLWEGRGYAGVEFCFVSLAEPSVPAALDKVARLGAGRVVVVPYFLFAGVLPDRVAAQAGQFAARRPWDRRPGRRGDRGLPGAGRPGAGAVPGGGPRRHPDELRHLRLPDRAARVRRQGGPAADAAPSS
jgi:sirohydrochlorin cobaltochelatase